jgi:hypothetical protein
MFSSSCTLPSPASAGSYLPLFGRFTGTTAQSDFSSTCMSVVRLGAFTDRPLQTAKGALEISRFSCMLFPQRARALSTTQDRSATRDNAAAVLPSSYSTGSRHPDLPVFRSSITPPTDASGLRFETHLAMGSARLEVRMESLSPFLWGSYIPYNMPVYPGARQYDRNRAD